MEAYNAPRLQKHVIRILWMPCVYGLDAWFALRFKARPLATGRTLLSPRSARAPPSTWTRCASATRRS